MEWLDHVGLFQIHYDHGLDLVTAAIRQRSRGKDHTARLRQCRVVAVHTVRSGQEPVTLRY
jgi:hypothetical protein